MMVNGWTVGVTPSEYGATWFVIDSPSDAAGFVLAMSRLGYVVSGSVAAPDGDRVPMTLDWLSHVETYGLGTHDDTDRDAVHHEAAIAAQWADAHCPDADIHHEGYGVAVYVPTSCTVGGVS